METQVVSLVQLARQPLPKCPLASEVGCRAYESIIELFIHLLRRLTCQIRLHWLCVEGVQPKTADNPLIGQCLNSLLFV